MKALYPARMLRRVPSLEDAEAFVAAARAGNMRAAAEHLALSPSALSRRIQALEDFVSVKLFVRRSRGLTLTPDGKVFLERVEQALDALGDAAQALRERGETLKIAASHTLTSEWLLPRLPRLLADLGTPVEIVVGDPLAEIKAGRADLALSGGYAAPEGFDTLALASGRSALVTAPSVSQACQWTRLKLARPLLPAMAAATTPDALPLAGGSIDLDRLARTPPILFATLQMAYEAAASGLGVALGVPLSSERFLAQGRVRACDNAICDIHAGYWLATRPGSAPGTDNRRRRLQDWLAEEAGQSMSRFKESTRTG